MTRRTLLLACVVTLAAILCMVAGFGAAPARRVIPRTTLGRRWTSYSLSFIDTLPPHSLRHWSTYFHPSVIGMEYIPDGMSKAQWEKLKKKEAEEEKKRSKNYGKVGNESSSTHQTFSPSPPYTSTQPPFSNHLLFWKYLSVLSFASWPAPTPATTAYA